jgi:hypothetical protein
MSSKLKRTSPILAMIDHHFRVRNHEQPCKPGRGTKGKGRPKAAFSAMRTGKPA